MFIDPAIRNDAERFVELRRAIHAHPELAFSEQRTADRVTRSLAEHGIAFERGIGGTGIVATLRRGTATRSIGLRADMDALPITEANDFAHRSAIADVMHACGHDGHTAMLLAAASHLAQHGKFDGTVHFVFQPGEESGRGARAMIDDGLFDRFPMDAIFGAHNWPNLAVGSFAVAPAAMMASCNEFKITVTGRGGHAAMPQEAIDPIQAGSAIAIALQSIVARNLMPSDAAVVSVTMFSAGDAIHVIPDVAMLQGTVRTFSSAVTDVIETRIRSIAQGVAASYGATVSVEFVRNCAPTVNTPNEAEFVRATLSSVATVETFTPAMTAEDFSFMLEAKPGCYFMIGNGAGDHRVGGHGLGPCVLHNASYDFNDALIPVGAQAWVRLVEAWLPVSG